MSSKKSVFQCKNCGKEFTEWTYRNPSFCSRQCNRESAAKYPRPAQKRPESFVVIICAHCGKSFQAHKTQLAKKYPMKYCSRDCKNASISRNMRGENNWLYVGGHENNRGPNWGSQARKARKRDNYTCAVCKRNGKIDKIPIEVHHKIPYRKFKGDFESANELDNLISLCRQCHVKVERGKVVID